MGFVMSASAAGSAGRAELGARRGGVNGVGVPNGSRGGKTPSQVEVAYGAPDRQRIRRDFRARAVSEG